jgi:hypothetical protein
VHDIDVESEIYADDISKKQLFVRQSHHTHQKMDHILAHDSEAM